jgi:hypothetical protein
MENEFKEGVKWFMTLHCDKGVTWTLGRVLNWKAYVTLEQKTNGKLTTATSAPMDKLPPFEARDIKKGIALMIIPGFRFEISEIRLVEFYSEAKEGEDPVRSIHKARSEITKQKIKAFHHWLTGKDSGALLQL